MQPTNCFTHLLRFPRFNLCNPMQSLAMQSLMASCHSLQSIQMAFSHGRQRNRLLCTNNSIFANTGTQPWMTAEPLLCTDYSIQFNTKHWQSAVEAAEPSAVHLQFNSCQNTGSQPWMTVEPLLCTYNSIQCNHWQSALDDSGTSAVHPAHQMVCAVLHNAHVALMPLHWGRQPHGD